MNKRIFAAVMMFLLVLPCGLLSACQKAEMQDAPQDVSQRVPPDAPQNVPRGTIDIYADFQFAHGKEERKTSHILELIELRAGGSFRPSITDYKDILGPINYKGAGEECYSVHEYSTSGVPKGYCFIRHDLIDENYGAMIWDTWCVVQIPSKRDFQNIKRGEATFDYILQLDPAAMLIEHASSRKSYHRFLDGTIAEVSYQKHDDQFVVYYIHFEDDPKGFVKILQPEDLALIQ